MKKVGIVSLYGLYNYGNRLQSYAAQEILRKLGFDTEVVYVEPMSKTVKDIIKNITRSSPLIKLKKNSNRSKAIINRKKAFLTFNDTYVKTRRFRSVDGIKGYDYYALGSDQVWNPQLYKGRDKELFMLTFTDNDKKICMAPSFGTDNVPAEWEDYFKRQLSSFPRLSVREAAGADIIRKLTDREATVVIDPTLMLSKDDWKKLSKKPKNINTDEKFILRYFLGGTTEKAQKDSDEAKKELGDCPVYTLYSLKDLKAFGWGPSEFLYMIEHASLIQTDSFHACVFSFIFGRPFLLYTREGKHTDMLSRMETLFNTFDLKRKYVDSGLENDMFECDYSVGYAKLAQEREKAERFLKESFGIMER